MKMIVTLALLAASMSAFPIETRVPSAEETALANASDADARLNKTYRELIAALNAKSTPKAKEALIAAQRAWIKQRDAECEFAAEASDDSAGRTVAYNHAKTRATESRIEALTEHLKHYRYDGSQGELNEAADKDARAADAELNKVYKRYMLTLDAASKKDLLEAERAWITFRNAAVRLEERQYEGGSIQPLMYLSAYLRITQAWVKELKDRENN